MVSPPPSHSPSQSPTIIIHPQALIQSQASSLVPAALQPEPAAPQAAAANPVRPSQPLSLPPHLPLPPSPAVHIGAMEPPSLVSPGQQLVSSTPHQQYPALQSAPIPLAAPPQLSASSTQIQPLPLQSVQSLQVQPEILSQGQVLVQNTLVSEEELPAAEALVQLPFQTLPPPQTVAVNLQVQPSVPIETPVVSDNIASFIVSLGFSRAVSMARSLQRDLNQVLDRGQRNLLITELSFRKLIDIFIFNC